MAVGRRLTGTMTTLTIYLVRHGQTLFNARHLVQGWVDSPLTDRGRLEAARAAEALRDRPIVGVWSSTSERAEDTAEIIAAHHPGVDVRRLKGLKEMHFGELEATPNEDFERSIDVRTVFSAMYAGTHPGFPGGESGAQYRARVAHAVEVITAAHPEGGEVVAVSHGVTINLVLTMAGWSSPGPLANASISVVRAHPEEGLSHLAVGVHELSRD